MNTNQQLEHAEQLHRKHIGALCRLWGAASTILTDNLPVERLRRYIEEVDATSTKWQAAVRKLTAIVLKHDGAAALS